MTPTARVLVDAFGRIREEVHATVEGLTEQQLTARIAPAANTIAWLVWHLTRVQDDHVSEIASAEQAWIDAGFAERFALPFDRRATGYGHTNDQVAMVRVGADLLLAYHDAVHERTVAFVRSITDADLDRVVDTRWDPPVTLAVRLVSVIADDLQHVGQAAFVRGIVTAS